MLLPCICGLIDWKESKGTSWLPFLQGVARGRGCGVEMRWDFIKVHFLTPYLSHESLAYILDMECGSAYRVTDFTALPGSYYQYI